MKYHAYGRDNFRELKLTPERVRLDRGQNFFFDEPESYCENLETSISDDCE